MKKLIPLMLILLLCLSTSPVGADEPTEEQNRINAINQALKSTVKLTVYSNQNALGVNAEATTGSGFFVAPNKILTAEHVVDTPGITRIDIETYGGGKCAGKVTYPDRTLDLAIIESDCTGEPLRVTDKLSIGQSIHLTGSPETFDWIATTGMVSNIVKENYHSTIIADIDGAHGNSGGPFVNNSGEVVGVAQWRGKNDTYLLMGITSKDVLRYLDRVGIK